MDIEEQLKSALAESNRLPDFASRVMENRHSEDRGQSMHDRDGGGPLPQPSCSPPSSEAGPCMRSPSAGPANAPATK